MSNVKSLISKLETKSPSSSTQSSSTSTASSSNSQSKVSSIKQLLSQASSASSTSSATTGVTQTSNHAGGGVSLSWFLNSSAPLFIESIASLGDKQSSSHLPSKMTMDEFSPLYLSMVVGPEMLQSVFDHLSNNDPPRVTPFLEKATTDAKKAGKKTIPVHFICYSRSCTLASFLNALQDFFESETKSTKESDVFVWIDFLCSIPTTAATPITFWKKIYIDDYIRRCCVNSGDKELRGKFVVAFSHDDDGGSVLSPLSSSWCIYEIFVYCAFCRDDSSGSSSTQAVLKLIESKDKTNVPEIHFYCGKGERISLHHQIIDGFSNLMDVLFASGSRLGDIEKSDAKNDTDVKMITRAMKEILGGSTTSLKGVQDIVVEPFRKFLVNEAVNIILQSDPFAPTVDVKVKERIEELAELGASISQYLFMNSNLVESHSLSAPAPANKSSQSTSISVKKKVYIDDKKQESLLKKCIDLSQNAFGPTHNSTVETKKLLGNFYLNQERFDDAVPYLSG